MWCVSFKIKFKDYFPSIIFNVYIYFLMLLVLNNLRPMIVVIYFKNYYSVTVL